MFSNTRASTALFALAAAVVALPAAAEEMKFMAELTGAAQVPPVETEAMGMADVTVDTEAMTITWMLMVEGLSGEAGAGHFHGPASPEETAPPVIDLSVDGTDETEEPIAQDIMEGRADLTEEQLADLQAGMYYINIHTAEHPDGEIRGQVMEGEADMSAMGGDAAGTDAAAADSATEGAGTTEGDAAAATETTTEGQASGTDAAMEGAATTEGAVSTETDMATEGEAAAEGEAATE